MLQRFYTTAEAHLVATAPEIIAKAVAGGRQKTQAGELRVADGNGSVSSRPPQSVEVIMKIHHYSSIMLWTYVEMFPRDIDYDN